MSAEEKAKEGIAVYCKCGGIIYCCTDTHYSDYGGKKEIDFYFDRGFQVGRVSKGDVQRLFGCKCNTAQVSDTTKEDKAGK